MNDWMLQPGDHSTPDRGAESAPSTSTTSTVGTDADDRWSTISVGRPTTAAQPEHRADRQVDAADQDDEVMPDRDDPDLGHRSARC